MTISQLIAKLQEIQAREGDLPVEVSTPMDEGLIAFEALSEPNESRKMVVVIVTDWR